MAAEYSPDEYSFVDFDQKPERLPKMAAIVRKKPYGGYGGFFVSGVHVEAGVTASEMLKAITQNVDKSIRPLPNPEEYHQETAMNDVLPLLVETLTRNSLKIY